MRAAAVILSFVIVSGAASAHHSNSEYDRSVLREFEGELVAVRWSNPHANFRLRTTSASGQAEEWELSALPIALLEKAGLSKGMFPVGARVKVAGWVSKSRASMLASNILLPSGEEALFYPQSRLRWSDKPAGGRWANEPVTRGERSLYRIWNVADLGAYLRGALAIEVKLTPAGQAKMTSTPPRFDPCRPQGMPPIMLNPLPIQFIDRGDHIDLQLATFGVLRRIETTAPPKIDAIPVSDFGYSVGRWVGDTLEVRTTRVGWPYVDDDGRPQSENVEILERFTLAADNGRLTYSQTVTDPQFLAEPMTVSWDLVDLGDESIEPLRCE